MLESLDHSDQAAALEIVRSAFGEVSFMWPLPVHGHSVALLDWHLLLFFSALPPSHLGISFPDCV